MTKFVVTRQALHVVLREKLKSPKLQMTIGTNENVEDISSLSESQNKNVRKCLSHSSWWNEHLSLKRNVVDITDLSSSSAVNVTDPSMASSTIGNNTKKSHTDSSIGSSTIGNNTKKMYRLTAAQANKKQIIKLKNKEEENTAYSTAIKEGLKLCEAAKKNRKEGVIHDGIRVIVKKINNKFLHNFDRKITRTTLLRYHERNVTEPLTKVPKTKIPEALYSALDYHTSMLRVRTMFLFISNLQHLTYYINFLGIRIRRGQIKRYYRSFGNSDKGDSP